MPTVKISQLNEFTGDTTGAYLIMNDATETATYKVKKENINSPAIPSAGFAWTANYFNLSNNTDTFIPFDNEIFNTDISVFELWNGGSTGNTGARVQFKKAGVYEITSQMHFYDIFGDIDMIVKVNSSSSSNGTMSSVTAINDFKSIESASDQIINGTILLNVTTPGYYTISIYVAQSASGNLPYPSDADNARPRIFVKKLS
jgi:hypothetical protein